MIAAAAALLAIVAAGVVVVRCICILYQSHWTTHPRGRWHWRAFGYSYVLLACGALCGAFAAAGARDYAPGAVVLMLIGSAGLILFDRRRRS